MDRPFDCNILRVRRQCPASIQGDGTFLSLRHGSASQRQRGAHLGQRVPAFASEDLRVASTPLADAAKARDLSALFTGVSLEARGNRTLFLIVRYGDRR